MQTPDILRLLLVLLLGLLAVIGGLLPNAFDKQKSLPGKCFIFLLGVGCGILLLVGSGLVTTEQAKQNAQWLQKLYWTLGSGYLFSLPTALYLLLSRQSKNGEISGKTVPATSPQTPEYWRRGLLKIMLADVNERLEDSLHNEQLIPLLMEDQREQVGRPKKMRVNSNPDSLKHWLQPDRWLEIFGVSKTQLKPGKKIIEVFEQDDIAGRLLILGAPGSGKTTTLLELARDLIQRAQQQPDQPIPVIFELSDWKDDKQSITEWLVADLKERNTIPEAITREWIKTGQLLPLLDGLDELGLIRQAKCVDKINEYLQTSSGQSQIVVCCRQEEYLEGNAILEKLRGAICLQALTDGQIENYLKRLGCGHLWKPINEDPEGLLELARMPLLLNLIPVAYPDGLQQQGRRFNDPTERQKYHEKCRRELFDAYIKRRLEQHHDRQGYSEEETKYWLFWLAKTLKERKQTEFLIEKLQPDMLEIPERDLQEKIISALISLIFPLCIGLIFALFVWVTVGLIFALILGLTNGLSTGLAYALIFGLTIGLIVGSSGQIEPAETLKWSWQRAKSGLISGLILGLMVGLIFGLMIGLIFGLMIGLIRGLTLGLFSDEIKIRRKPNQGIRESAKNVVIISLINLPASLLLYLLTFLHTGRTIEPSNALITGLVIALFCGIIFGGLPCIQHFVLRLFLWRSGAIPWNYAHFLSYAAERRFISQVGGRYRFLHDLLREHFAEMDKTGSAIKSS